MRTVVWFRGKDLRLSDHEPLRSAIATGEVVPLFVLDPYFFASVRARELPHRIQFLLDSLRALQANIARRGSQLIVVNGKAVDVVPRLVRDWQADRVVAHREVEPIGRERDRRIRAALGDRFELFEGEMLLSPGTLRTRAGAPYAVFSHFARAFRSVAAVAEPLAAPRVLPGLPKDVRVGSVEVPWPEDLGLVTNQAILRGGEEAGRERLRRFSRGAARDYAELRNRVDLSGTSRLSADLKFGTISVRQVWRAVEAAAGNTEGGRSFLNELLWREFAYSTLWDRPELLDQPFRASFTDFPWQGNDDLWRAWTAGTTGYPIVDASARQLLGEGFVHNRARMISASFLTKHLLIHYRRGEAHYMKYLTDGDWANNNMGWQWSAGCGCDAQPYFRIFNPVTQGQRFDPEGDYVRRWVPELARLPAKFIHRPWAAPDDVLRAAGVRLDRDYPRPVVDHALARGRFLAIASEHMRSRGHHESARRGRD